MWSGAVAGAVIFGALVRVLIVAGVSGFVQLILAGMGAPTSVFVLVNGVSLVWAVVWIALGVSDGWEELARQQEEEDRRRRERRRHQEQWRAQPRPERRKEFAEDTRGRVSKRGDSAKPAAGRKRQRSERPTRRRRTRAPASPSAAPASGNTGMLAMVLSHNAIRLQVPVGLAGAAERVGDSATPVLSLSRSVLLGAASTLADSETPQRPDGSRVPSTAASSAEELAFVMADLLSTEAGWVAIEKAWTDTQASLEGDAIDPDDQPSLGAPSADLGALAREITSDGTALDVLVLLRSALQVERDLRLQQSDDDAAAVAEAMCEALHGILGLLASANESTR